MDSRKIGVYLYLHQRGLEMGLEGGNTGWEKPAGVGKKDKGLCGGSSCYKNSEAREKFKDSVSEINLCIV